MRALLAAGLALVAVAFAQPSLVVNGVGVPGATTSLVTDLTYAPAGDFARALGADAVVDAGSGRVTLTLGAAIVQLALVADGGSALRVAPAIVRDGQVRPGPAAVWNGSEVFVPVKAVGEAFGGRVAFLTDTGTVAVVLPRPRMTMRLEGRGATERLVFAFDAPARVVSYQHPGTAVLELRFERADPVAPVSLEGDGFVWAALEAVRGTAEARVQLTPGVTPRVWSVPAGAGMEVVVAFGADPTPTPTVALRGTRWVLDAGHVAGDGLSASVEGDLTRAFVDQLATLLVRSDLVVERTRPGLAPVSLADRAAAGVGADGFVSVHLGDLPRGRVRIYVLDDARGLDALDRAVRWNAEEAASRPETDGIRRAVLLRLLPNLDIGRGWAEALAGRLAAAGWSVDAPTGAPLAVLTGAAGRGLLIEMSAEDLRDPSAATTLAGVLVDAWAALGGR
jgi:N-acetylmuramoyl-L-alanine amidase